MVLSITALFESAEIMYKHNYIQVYLQQSQLIQICRSLKKRPLVTLKNILIKIFIGLLNCLNKNTKVDNIF